MPLFLETEDPIQERTEAQADSTINPREMASRAEILQRYLSKPQKDRKTEKSERKKKRKRRKRREDAVRIIDEDEHIQSSTWDQAGEPNFSFKMDRPMAWSSCSMGEKD